MKSQRQILAIGVTGLLILTSMEAGCATQASALQTLEKDEPSAPAGQCRTFGLGPRLLQVVVKSGPFRCATRRRASRNDVSP